MFSASSSAPKTATPSEDGFAGETRIARLALVTSAATSAAAAARAAAQASASAAAAAEAFLRVLYPASRGEAAEAEKAASPASRNPETSKGALLFARRGASSATFLFSATKSFV